MKTILLIFVGLVFSTKSINAQTNEQRRKIEASMSPKINTMLLDQFFNEVHKGSEYKMNDDRRAIYLEQLSRFEFIYSPYVENKNHPLLSSIERMDKYNPTLDFSLNDFKPEEFNFIKYGFNFYLPYSQMIRVDGQDYLIKIKQYEQK